MIDYIEVEMVKEGYMREKDSVVVLESDIIPFEYDGQKWTDFLTMINWNIVL